MKFFAVFSALLAVACAGNTWTVNQLGEAIQSPYVDASLKPYLEAALNDMMTALWAGQQIEAVTVTLPSMDFSTWTINDLSAAIQNPETDPALIPHLETALNHMMESLFTGTPVVAAAVTVPATELHYYTLNELSLALQDPTTNPALLPYLESALNEIMTALFEGNQVSFTVIAVPAGLTPVEIPAEVIPAPVVVPSPVETEVSPVAPAAPASPLVQIIVNINQQEAATVPAAPVVIPGTPVQVIESAPIAPEPIHVVESAPVAPEPIQVVESAPEPIQVIETAPIVVEPVQVVETAPGSVPIGIVAPAA